MVLRSLVLIAVVLSLSVPATSVSAGPAIDLPGLRIEYDWMPPISGHGYRVDGIPRGEWRVVGSRFDDDATPTLTWAQQLATDLVREDRRSRLSDELYPDVVGEILLAKLEHRDPVARATAWLRAERSWRHHLAPLLDVA